MKSTQCGNRSRWPRVTLLLAGLLSLFATDAQAQQSGRINGRVTDASTGAPLSDVQVYLVGANLGSISRQNGTYVILSVPPGNYELRAERIGLSTVSRQITVAAGAVLDENFQLTAQALGLDEIVVTGTAGAATRREVGNSVTQINTVDLPDRPTSVVDMLTGVAPGLEVLNNGGGETGQGSTLVLRGINTIQGGQQTPPVIYIDGIRIMSDLLPNNAGGSSNRSSVLDQLNPMDIERIEVISGPAASTLYGTDAAGGVIQVFTRRGSNRAPVWTAEVQQGTMWNQKFGANGVDYIHMDPWICTAPFKCGEFQHTPLQQLYSLSVRGGAQALQYFVSGGYEDEVGGTPADALERWNVRGNFTLNPVEDLVVQWNSAYSNTWQENGATGNAASGLTLNVFRQEQNYFGTADKNIINTALDWDNSRTIERFTTGGTVTYSPTANLTQRLTIGYDFTQQEQRSVQPFGFIPQPQGTITVNNYSRRFLTFDYVGTYTFNFGEALRSSFSWGGQATGDASVTVEASGEGFPGAAVPTVNSASSTLGEESRQKVWNSGFFFQNVFDLRNRYFLNVGLRVDGNSTFGKNFNLQMYPKASLSWVLSDESFWNPGFGEMKLRAAYGRSGRAPGALVARRTWTNTGLEGEAAFTPSNLGNPDIGPEVTSELELGFDASWWNSRVRPSVSYYRQTTDDAIQSISPIPSLGFTSNVNFNIGKVQNKGLELRLDLTPIETARFGWDINTTFSKNKSNVLQWEGNEDDPRVGRPIAYRTWNMYENPEGMGSTRRSEGVYAAQSCKVPAPGVPAGEQGDSIPRPGVDPSFHACQTFSTHTFGYPLSRPSTLATLNTTVRLPAGISVSARTDYIGGEGYFRSVNAMGSAVGRNVRSPVCIPYYLNPTGVVLRPDTPALWVHRCTPGLNQAYDVEGEEFRIQSVSATFPMDFAFPDRIQNAVLTLVLNNPKVFHHHLWGMGGQSERLPPTTSLRASLRLTF